MIEAVFLGKQAPEKDWAFRWCMRTYGTSAHEQLNQTNDIRRQQAVNDISAQWILQKLRISVEDVRCKDGHLLIATPIVLHQYLSIKPIQDLKSYVSKLKKPGYMRRTEDKLPKR